MDVIITFLGFRNKAQRWSKKGTWIFDFCCQLNKYYLTAKKGLNLFFIATTVVFDWIFWLKIFFPCLLCLCCVEMNKGQYLTWTFCFWIFLESTDLNSWVYKLWWWIRFFVLFSCFHLHFQRFFKNLPFRWSSGVRKLTLKSCPRNWADQYSMSKKIFEPPGQGTEGSVPWQFLIKIIKVFQCIQHLNTIHVCIMLMLKIDKLMLFIYGMLYNSYLVFNFRK